MAMSEIAKRFKLSADLVQSTVSAHLGTAINGRIDSGILYTDQYIARLKSQVQSMLDAGFQMTVQSNQTYLCQLQYSHFLPSIICLGCLQYWTRCSVMWQLLAPSEDSQTLLLEAASLQICEALKEAVHPVNLASLIRQWDLQALHSTSKTLVSLTEELITEGAIQGSLQPGTSIYTPAAHADMQQKAAESFYTQNAYIE